MREHVRAHHSGPDPKYNNSPSPYVCKVCNDALPTSEELIAHIIAHCDHNTASRRQPTTGPRKYKRRRKIKQDTIYGSGTNESADMLEGASESDDNSKRKIVKKVKTRPTIDESYQSILKTFESSIQNISSITNNSKGFGAKPRTPKKKVNKKEDKKNNAAGTSNANEMPSTSQIGRPKMIHTQKTRVPVALGMEGAKRGQKTKTMVMKTPKVIPMEQTSLFAPVASERNRPRTKNVSYHIEGRQSFVPAMFPPKFMEDNTLHMPPPLVHQSHSSQSMELINVKIEPGLQKFNQNHTYNNNGNISDFQMDIKPQKAPARRRTPAKKTKARRSTTTASKKSIAKTKSENNKFSNVNDKFSNNNDELITTQEESNVESETIASSQLFDSVDDGNNLDVAFEANVVTEQPDLIQESILPDFDKVNDIEEIVSSNDNSVKLSVKVESAHDRMMNVHNLMGAVEETVPETIIPDTVEYTCEMCALVFETRNELLLHVPIHI